MASRIETHTLIESGAAFLLFVGGWYLAVPLAFYATRDTSVSFVTTAPTDLLVYSGHFGLAAASAPLFARALNTLYRVRTLTPLSHWSSATLVGVLILAGSTGVVMQFWRIRQALLPESDFVQQVGFNTLEFARSAFTAILVTTLVLAAVLLKRTRVYPTLLVAARSRSARIKTSKDRV